MGLSGGGSSKSYSGSGQKWATPIAKQAAADTTSVFNANQGNLNNITSGVTGLLPSIQAKYTQGDPALNAATNYDVNLLGRDPFAGSPGLTNLINSTDAHVGDQVNANFGSRGAFGGTAHTTALARALADNEVGLRYQDSQNVMAAQGAASANAPQKAAAGYLGITPYLAAAQTGAALPYTGINAQATDLNNLFAGGTQKTTQPSGLGAFIGQGLSTAASLGAFSDRRLKENIERVGELPDGLGVYRWNYVWDAPEARHEGVMADEVAELRPWALGPQVEGFATVYYGLL